LAGEKGLGKLESGGEGRWVKAEDGENHSGAAGAGRVSQKRGDSIKGRKFKNDSGHSQPGKKSEGKSSIWNGVLKSGKARSRRSDQPGQVIHNKQRAFNKI